MSCPYHKDHIILVGYQSFWTDPIPFGHAQIIKNSPEKSNTYKTDQKN